MRNAEFFTRVQTGHSAGRITISLREADTVKREKTRVQFDEPQRTLVGHFRHELGHYIWDRLVSGRDENRFRQLIAYEAAMARHHSQGPIGNWQRAFISAYATMHPWEDFAETVGAYSSPTSGIATWVCSTSCPKSSAPRWSKK